MKEGPIIGEAALHAFLDGELDDEARQDVEAWLSQNPEDLVRLGIWRKQKEDLKAYFNPVIKEKVPASLKQTINQSRILSPRATWTQVAATLFMFVLGGLAGWGVTNLATPKHKQWPSFAVQAVNVHAFYTAGGRRPVVAASGKKALLAQVNKRAARRVQLPEILAKRFKLIGGRIVPVDGKAAAQFMFQDKRGKRVTLLVGRNPKGQDSKLKVWAKGRLRCGFWYDGPVKLAFSGELEKAEVLKISKALQKRFAKL